MTKPTRRENLSDFIKRLNKKSSYLTIVNPVEGWTITPITGKLKEDILDGAEHTLNSLTRGSD